MTAIAGLCHEGKVMFAIRDASMEPEERIRMALQAAEHHSAGVRGPFVIQSI